MRWPALRDLGTPAFFLSISRCVIPLMAEGKISTLMCHFQRQPKVFEGGKGVPASAESHARTDP